MVLGHFIPEQFPSLLVISEISPLGCMRGSRKHSQVGQASDQDGSTVQLQTRVGPTKFYHFKKPVFLQRGSYVDELQGASVKICKSSHLSTGFTAQKA